MTRPVTLFAAATLIPIPLLLAAAAFGGAFVAVALACLTVFTFAMDELVAFAGQDAPEGSEFPAADTLSAFLAVAHYVLLGVAIWAISWDGFHTGWEKAGLFAAFGIFFGQVSNSNAHELIHRSSRGLRRLGAWVYTSLLFGHHTSAHTRIHHRYIGTTDDPNTARLGESFYAYAIRAWGGSFKAGLEIETSLLQQRDGTVRLWRHPYTGYLGGSAIFLGCAALIGGLGGVLTLLGLAAYAQMQLLLSDYVQHYGLVRQIMPNGKPEPVVARHSWNAPHWFSSALMLNAPRHSDHHAHPGKRYPGLTLPDAEDAPMLPRSLPTMAVLALYPPFWRKIMDARAMEWRVGVGSQLRMAAE
ncbi:alkane 1-monooxygenase [Cognatishimia sp. MH4019]|uniref:alkane 1-monooxygenase n=1 Tax=Cognatishimia sp. MH4019 TaxID=2854030 RepID=UPI001CD26CC9|nr:alkane 1-monooxygenase [Cognatishimia sp. MH4019]